MLLIGLAAAAGCGSEPSAVLIGKWGAAAVELRATPDQAWVALECGAVTTEAALEPDADGHFLVNATRSFSGPVGELPAYLEGRVRGSNVELRWWSTDGEPPEQFVVLQPGVQSGIRAAPCPT
jgi:hypothetical protein